MLDVAPAHRWRYLWIWLAAMLIALVIDGQVARALLPYRVIVKQSHLAEEVREGGHFVLAMVIALLLVVLHPAKWRGATLLLLSGIVVGAMRAVLAIGIGRVRPVVRIAPLEFHPFNLTASELLHAHNLSFPSGHTSLAFALAAALAYLLPKGRWLFFVAASLVAIERVAELAHYVSDVVAAALLGLLAFQLTLPLHAFLCRKWNERTERLRPHSAV